MFIEQANVEIERGRVYDVDFECRDNGDGMPDRGSIEAYWTGEVDTWGKLTFISTNRRQAHYLFPDELLEVEPV